MFDSFVPTAAVPTFDGPADIRRILQLTPWRVVSAQAYGARGDGTGDDGPAINRAIVAAQADRNGTVVLGPGHFRVTTPLLFAGANKGIALLGMPTPSAAQQGSTPAPCVLEWAGGGGPAISVTTSFVSPIANLAIYNTGGGTAAFSFNPNGHVDLSHVSFAGPSGSTPWSQAAIVSIGGLNYSAIRHCNFDVSPALKMSGVHTTLEIANCVFDAAGANPAIDLNGVAGDIVSIHNCTFNSQATASTFVDSSASTGALGNLVIRDCEFDCAAGAFQSFIAKLKNVYNVSFYNNEVSSFGNAANVASLIQLTNVARAHVWGNNLNSVNPPLVTCLDAVSRVFQGANRAAAGSTQGILAPAGAVPGTVVAVTPGSAVAGTARLHGDLLSPSAPGVFAITAVNNTAFSLALPAPLDAVDPGTMEPGQVFHVQVRNASGGVMGAVTFSAQFKTAGAFTVPANGFSRTITFYHDGTNAVEINRSAADVAN